MTQTPPEKAEISPRTPVNLSGDEVVKVLLRASWRYRWQVLLIALLGASLGGALSSLGGRYVAQGLLLTHEFDLARYKQYEEAFGNSQSLLAFVQANGLEGTQTEEVFNRLALVPGELAKAIRPAFAVTGREAKAYDIQAASGDIIGINISVERKNLSKESPVQHVATYVRHMMVEVDLRDRLLTQCLGNRSRELRLRNEQLDSDFALSQAQLRAEKLRNILRDVPHAAAIDGRQLVSFRPGEERFLPPTAQLVAVEVQIVESALSTQRRQRELVSAKLRSDYYCGARELQQSVFGLTLLQRLTALHTQVFSEQDRTAEIVEFTANELLIERQSWVDRYTELSRFVAPPEGGEVLVRSPGLAVGLLLGLFLGGGFGLLVALSLAWWHNHRQEVWAVDVG